MKIKGIKKERIALLSKVVFCVVATIGVLEYLKIPNNFAITVIVFSLYLFLYDKFTAKYRYIALAYSVFLSAVLIIGGQLDISSEISWNINTVLEMASFTVSLFLPVYKIIGYLERTSLKKGKKLSRKEKLLIYMIIVVSNVLIFLALYPGIYGWDSALQGYRAMYGGTTSHYSVLLGSIFGFLLKIGKDVFGSYDVGMAISMIAQLLVVSAVYARVVFFMCDRYNGLSSAVWTIIYFIFILLFGAMTVYSTQDVMFGAVFALIFIELWEMSCDDLYWKRKKNVAKYILLGTLLCLCRNNGVYMLMLAVLVSLFVFKKGKKRNILIMILPIIFSFIYSGPVLSMLHIEKTDTINEMMSIPSQQIARVYTSDNGDIGEDEKQKVEYYYDKVERFKEYGSYTAKADKTKGALNSDKVKSSFLDYISLWIKIGFKNPKKYIEAFLLNSLGTWYPGKKYNDPRANIPYIEFGMNTLWDEYDGKYSEMRIDRKSKMVWYERILSDILYENKWQDIPVVSVLYSIGSYFVLVVFAVMMYIYRKQYHLFVPMALVVGLYITVLLGPVAIFRYCYPVLIIVPVILGGLKRYSFKKDSNKFSVGAVTG